MKDISIKYYPMGEYQTNCYIVSNGKEELIIDPGIGAFDWVVQNVKNPLAILNTHGHFDHVWSNAKLQEFFKIPLYVPKEDAFMLTNDPLGRGTPPSTPDVLVNEDQSFQIGDFEVSFFHHPGHTPGCSIIEISGYIFSGDFVFKNSIGRVDFPFSDPAQMIKSIYKFLARDENKIIYTGHGEPTTVFNERSSLKNWLNYLS